MQIELQTPADLKERAQLYHERIVHLQEQLVFTFLDLGEAFSKIQKEHLYEELGYKRFNEYLKSPDVKLCRSKVYGLIRIFDVLVLEHRISRDRILGINWSKLYLLNRHLQNGNPGTFPGASRNELKNGNSSSSLSAREAIQEADLWGADQSRFFRSRPGLSTKWGSFFYSLRYANNSATRLTKSSRLFPDCIGRRKRDNDRDNRWEKVRIEFEYKSRDFVPHLHPERRIDMIICWEHNWPACKLEVLSLKDVIKDLKFKGEL